MVKHNASLMLELNYANVILIQGVIQNEVVLLLKYAPWRVVLPVCDQTWKVWPLKFI